MSPAQGFGVAVRVVGLLVMLYGLYALLVVVFMVLMMGPDIMPVRMNLATAAAALLIGYYLLQGGGLVQRIAYADGGSTDR